MLEMSSHYPQPQITTQLPWKNRPPYPERYFQVDYTFVDIIRPFLTTLNPLGDTQLAPEAADIAISVPVSEPVSGPQSTTPGDTPADQSDETQGN